MYPNLDRFKRREFPSEKELKLTDPKILTTLDDYAKRLQAPVHPSTAKGALARTTGSANSRHYAVNRLSTAVDFFPDCDICKAWAIAINYFGGVGVYFDTHYRHNPKIMIHGDLRQIPTFWYRSRNIYYSIKNPQDLIAF